MRRRLARALSQHIVDPDAVTLPSYNKRRQARFYQFSLFVVGVLLGVCLVFASEIDEGVSESRMWIAHELRAMKSHPTDEDLALPRPHRMVARPPRKHLQSPLSVVGVPVLDVTELPQARRLSP